MAFLARATWHGIVEGSVPGLAHLCRMDVEDFKACIEILESPDQYSRNPENNGRRIESIPGGWKILNYEIYREKTQAKPGSRAEYMRKYRKSGEIEENRPPEMPQDKQFNTPPCDCNTVTKRNSEIVTCDTDKDKDKDKDYLLKNKTLCADFESFWKEYPLRNGSKRGKNKAFIEWKKTKPDTILLLKIISSLKSQIENYKDCKLHEEFVAEFPDPERWLKNKRWEDEVKIKSWIERSRETK